MQKRLADGFSKRLADAFAPVASGGSPFSATKDPNVLKTSGGEAVRLLEDVRKIWKEQKVSEKHGVFWGPGPAW